MRVFISHTSDLESIPQPGSGSYVAAAKDAIVRSEYTPLDMAEFSPDDRPAIWVCKDYVQGSDIYVGIIGWRYGSSISDGRSYTEWEFDVATDSGVHRLIVLLDDDRTRRGVSQFDLERQTQFRKKLTSSDLIFATASSPEELGKILIQALMKYRVRYLRKYFAEYFSVAIGHVPMVDAQCVEQLIQMIESDSFQQMDRLLNEIQSATPSSPVEFPLLSARSAEAVSSHRSDIMELTTVLKREISGVEKRLDLAIYDVLNRELLNLEIYPAIDQAISGTGIAYFSKRKAEALARETARILILELNNRLAVGIHENLGSEIKDLQIVLTTLPERFNLRASKKLRDLDADLLTVAHAARASESALDPFHFDLEDLAFDAIAYGLEGLSVDEDLVLAKLTEGISSDSLFTSLVAMILWILMQIFIHPTTIYNREKRIQIMRERIASKIRASLWNGKTRDHLIESAMKPLRGSLRTETQNAGQYLDSHAELITSREGLISAKSNSTEWMETLRKVLAELVEASSRLTKD
jgi:hypothetical protein